MRDSLKIRERDYLKLLELTVEYVMRFTVLKLIECQWLSNSQLIEAEAKVLVCDDFNFDDALGILRGNSVVGLKHLIVVGSEGKSQGCIPAW